jgi:hypothetical protein
MKDPGSGAVREATVPAARTALALVLLVAAAGDAVALRLSSVEIGLGAVWNARSTLRVEQTGEPDVEIRADWSTRSFDGPMYYMMRIGARTNGGQRWEIQFVHHKLYLENPTAEVQHFEITHGFNLFTFDRVGERTITWRAGAGIVVPHTDSTVRGQSSHGGDGIFGTGYRIGGPALLVGAGKEIDLGERWFVVPELQATAGWVRVKVADGDARTSNLALHFLLSLGWRPT